MFFEVLLAASCGLLLHGSGVARVSAGIQYIAVNLVASFLLLISIALIYGVTGTLNMADLALRAGELAGADRMLFEAGAAVLGVAFLVKAGAWPLNFWLVRGYGSAGAPIAAMFSIMTKVGIYALLRIGSLLLPTGAPAAFSLDWMFAAGLATLLFGGLGLLATQQLEKMVGYCVIVSAGTLLTALGMPGVTLTGPALFYLISSVLTTGAFFMLAEAHRAHPQFWRQRAGRDAGRLRPGRSGLGEPLRRRGGRGDSGGHGLPRPGLHQLRLAGDRAAAAVGLRGQAFAAVGGGVGRDRVRAAAGRLAAGGRRAAVWPGGPDRAGARGHPRVLGQRRPQHAAPARVIEAGPVAVLILLCVGLAAGAGPVSAYLDDAARSLDHPKSYIDAVMSAQTVRAAQGGQ